MMFFFPDSLDFVDPDFDFEREAHPPYRIRHRTDRYAHELLDAPPYHGILVSKSIVQAEGGRYTEAQRQRLRRTGARRFFRLARPGSPALQSMGDCGAYAYMDRAEPPFSVSEVLDFYEEGGFDYVLSVDHVIPGYYDPHRPSRKRRSPVASWKQRQAQTLQLAADFLLEHQARGAASKPLGVAQGWDPPSYARAVRGLQAMGYDYIALGGLAALPTQDILACVEAVAPVRRAGTRLHLLGVARLEHLKQFDAWGVASFDSTMPLRQAFMDDKHNYHTPVGAYLAIRVPQVLANTQLKRRIREGAINSVEAKRLEKDSLHYLQQYESGTASLVDTLRAVRVYEQAFNGRDQTEAYRRLLEDRPWQRCACSLCRALGIQIVIFRGRERNKRRGFHNLFVLFNKLPQGPARIADKQENRDEV